MKIKTSILDKIAILFFFTLLTIAVICFAVQKSQTVSQPSIDEVTKSSGTF
jgi:hypothetical protein